MMSERGSKGSSQKRDREEQYQEEPDYVRIVEEDKTISKYVNALHHLVENAALIPFSASSRKTFCFPYSTLLTILKEKSLLKRAKSAFGRKKTNENIPEVKNLVIETVKTRKGDLEKCIETEIDTDEWNLIRVLDRFMDKFVKTELSHEQNDNIIQEIRVSEYQKWLKQHSKYFSKTELKKIFTPFEGIPLSWKMYLDNEDWKIASSSLLIDCLVQIADTFSSILRFTSDGLVEKYFLSKVYEYMGDDQLLKENAFEIMMFYSRVKTVRSFHVIHPKWVLEHCPKSRTKRDISLKSTFNYVKRLLPKSLQNRSVYLATANESCAIVMLMEKLGVPIVPELKKKGWFRVRKKHMCEWFPWLSIIPQLLMSMSKWWVLPKATVTWRNFIVPEPIWYLFRNVVSVNQCMEGWQQLATYYGIELTLYTTIDKLKESEQKTHEITPKLSYLSAEMIHIYIFQMIVLNSKDVIQTWNASIMENNHQRMFSNEPVFKVKSLPYSPSYEEIWQSFERDNIIIDGIRRYPDGLRVITENAGEEGVDDDDDIQLFLDIHYPDDFKSQYENAYRYLINSRNTTPIRYVSLHTILGYMTLHQVHQIIISNGNHSFYPKNVMPFFKVTRQVPQSQQDQDVMFTIHRQTRKFDDLIVGYYRNEPFEVIQRNDDVFSLQRKIKTVSGMVYNTGDGKSGYNKNNKRRVQVKVESMVPKKNKLKETIGFKISDIRVMGKEVIYYHNYSPSNISLLLSTLYFDDSFDGYRHVNLDLMMNVEIPISYKRLFNLRHDSSFRILKVCEEEIEDANPILNAPNCMANFLCKCCILYGPFVIKNGKQIDQNVLEKIFEAYVKLNLEQISMKDFSGIVYDMYKRFPVSCEIGIEKTYWNEFLSSVRSAKIKSGGTVKRPKVPCYVQLVNWNEDPIGMLHSGCKKSMESVY